MTEEQYEALWDITSQFWVEFSQLCNRTLAKCEELGIDPDEAEIRLAEKTSFYGRGPYT